jgi:excinuclease ABC subunit A
MKLGGLSIHEVTALSISKAHIFFSQLKLSGKRAVIAQRILKEIIERLGFLENVGLSYLTLDRSAHSLSGGESQRIRLATQIGSKLTGVLYVLDEPSIGLHQRDNQRLLQTLLQMRDIGNTVLIVEHDEENGGHVVFSGTPQSLLQHETSLTGNYLAGRMRIEIPPKRRNEKGPKLIMKGACQNNLKKIEVAFPLGCFICVTGVRPGLMIPFKGLRTSTRWSTSINLP